LGFFLFVGRIWILKGTKTYGSGTPMFTVENSPYHKIALAGRTVEQAAIILCLSQTLAETLMTETQQSLLTNSLSISSLLF
jgi:hypothetical protein